MSNMENFINGCFLIDVVINFFSAYYDNEYDIIADHKVRSDRC
jgi:hypothetical protein